MEGRLPSVHDLDIRYNEIQENEEAFSSTSMFKLIFKPTVSQLQVLKSHFHASMSHYEE